MTRDRLVSDRLITICGAADLAILAVVFVLLYTEPGGGDFLGPPAAAVMLVLPPLAALAVAFSVWVWRQRITLLLLASTIAAWIGLGTLLWLVPEVAYANLRFAPLIAMVVPWPLVVVGAGEVLRAHRLERWTAFALLVALAALGVASGDLLPVVVALGSLVLVARISRQRGPVESGPSAARQDPAA